MHEVASRRPGSPPALGFRPAIEGLRAVAVVLVVLDHVFAWPRGGFIGVDVFFVISGYLITGLLANEYAVAGRISIRGFYRRRVRRILPAAVLVLLATWVASQLLFLASRAHQTGVDILWAAGFSANIHFAAIDTDYFQADRPQSPVQHFWSLAVEEQFYVVWPLLLIVLLWVGRRLLPARPQLVPRVAAAVLLAVLFGLALQLTHDNSANAYFATPARAWELGVGALLALLMSGAARLPDRLAELTMGVGLATLVVAAFTTPATHGFPAPGAVPAVVGTVLVILASSARRDTVAGRALTNPAARYVGRLSYSLYLWHWPVIVFVQARLIGDTAYIRTVEIFLAVALTLASYTFVEDPIRRRGLAALRPRRRARRPRDGRLTERGYAAVATTACLLLSFVVWQSQSPRATRTFDTAVVDPIPVSAAARPYGEVVPPATLTNAIDHALGATAFPALHPVLDDLPSARVPEWHACGNVGPGQVAGCTFPGAGPPARRRSIAVIGDSIGITWLPAIRGLQSAGYTVYGLTYGQCPAADIAVKPSVGDAARFATDCADHRNFAVAEVARLHPDVVVLANSVETISRLADGATGARADTEWQAATERIARRVTAAGARRVVLLAPPPAAPDLQTCAASPASRPGDCVSQLSTRWRGLTTAEAAAAKAVHIVYVDVRLLFCAANGYCPSFVGSTIVRVDGLHLTQGYSASLAGILDPLITGGVK